MCGSGAKTGMAVTEAVPSLILLGRPLALTAYTVVAAGEVEPSVVVFRTGVATSQRPQAVTWGFVLRLVHSNGEIDRSIFFTKRGLLLGASASFHTLIGVFHTEWIKKFGAR